jgi:Rrf2 family protein
MKKSTMLSTTAEHALRALAEIAALGKGEVVLGKQLAQRAGIPQNYLSKILWTLGQAGLITATRGCGGGYRLKRDAARIRLIEVVSLFDRQKGRRCFLGGAHCSDTDACMSLEGWRQVQDAYEGFLERTTVAQISRMHDPPPVKPAVVAAIP